MWIRRSIYEIFKIKVKDFIINLKLMFKIGSPIIFVVLIIKYKEGLSWWGENLQPISWNQLLYKIPGIMIKVIFFVIFIVLFSILPGFDDILPDNNSIYICQKCSKVKNSHSNKCRCGGKYINQKYYKKK